MATEWQTESGKKTWARIENMGTETENIFVVIASRIDLIFPLLFWSILMLTVLWLITSLFLVIIYKLVTGSGVCVLHAQIYS